MQIMTKINDFEEIFFKSSIIFHVFAQTIVSAKRHKRKTPGWRVIEAR